MTGPRAVPVAVLLLVLAGLVTGCARGEQPGVKASDATAWKAYRAQVVPDLDRVLGPTAGLKAACRSMLDTVPAPRYGVDLSRTLHDCSVGDTSDARQYAHQQVDHVATNDHALGLLH